ncbi:MAG: metallophosphoesterase family protein [Desulfobacterales bacterium]|nr:metallophosphoesterase family protein [Desulfobacterales bacterium]
MVNYTPMRLAVISDIHSNTDAFVRVLANADLSHVDEMVCLGDVIGYGPEPNEAIRLIRERNIPTVMGNHELGIVRKDYLNLLNPIACKSLQMTIELLSEESLSFVTGLEPFLVFHDSRFVHGFPPDSPTTYMFEISNIKMKNIFGQYKEKLCFTGHTHTPEIIEFDGDFVIRTLLKRGITHMDKDKRYIINAGSVGQPRDGDNNAKYLIWDTSEDSIEIKYVPYDIDSAVNKIIKAGLPAFNARRLL